MSDAKSTPPKPPAGLRPGSRSFWTRTVADYDLNPGELVLLGEACRLVDDLAKLRGAMAKAPVTTEGSTGQVRVHPIYAAIANHSRVLAEHVHRLGIPEPAADEQGQLFGINASTSARDLAHKRWRTA